MESQDNNHSGVATYIIDAVVAVLVLIMGLVIAFSSHELGSGWTSDGPGPGYFPFYVGVILVISSLGILYQCVAGKKNDEPFVDREQLGRVLSVLVPSVVYVAGIQLIGIYVSSAAFIALFMIILGKFNWLKAVIAAVAVNALFFMMFEVWFKVPLFKGAFDPLSFLGY